MNTQILTQFFMWCTILNFGFLMLMAVLCMFASDFIYKTHVKWFSISRETFDAIFYSSIGIYKLFFLFFNVVPWIVLTIIG
jgi:amino acid transporter